MSNDNQRHCLNNKNMQKDDLYAFVPYLLCLLERYLEIDSFVRIRAESRTIRSPPLESFPDKSEQEMSERYKILRTN